MRNTDTNQFPPAVERAIQIMNYLNNSGKAKSTREIATELGIPTASAYRIINCLVAYDYLRGSKTSDKYYLGYRLSVLGRGVFYGSNLCEIAHPYMEQLASASGQACQLCVLSDNAIITIDQTLPLSVITVIAKLNEKIPINLSAGGTLLVAMMSSAEQKSFINNAWKLVRQQTINSITDLETFQEKLRITRDQQYGTDYEEYAMGIGCLAVPVLNEEGNAIASLGLTGHIASYRDPQTFEFLLAKLRSFSKSISQEFLH